MLICNAILLPICGDYLSMILGVVDGIFLPNKEKDLLLNIGGLLKKLSKKIKVFWRFDKFN